MFKIKKVIIEIGMIICGCIIASLGTAVFLLPNKISTGGFAGIATVLYYMFNIPLGRTIILLNIPFFIWAFIKLGKEFTIKTIFATMLYSVFLNYLERKLVIKTDLFLGSIFGGALAGVGLAIVFKADASTGGSDLIAHIAAKYSRNFTMNNVLMFVDILVVLLNLILLKDFKVGLYSIIAIYIDGKMIDLVFEGINFCKVVYIISDKYNEIIKDINLNANKGATALYGKGAYTNERKLIVLTVIKRNEISNIINIVKKRDYNAFIIISDAREVYGLGFKNYF